jgi:hypothetical protein
MALTDAQMAELDAPSKRGSNTEEFIEQFQAQLGGAAAFTERAIDAVTSLGVSEFTDIPGPLEATRTGLGLGDFPTTDKEPDTMGGRAGQLAGFAAAATIPIGGAASRIPATTKAATTFTGKTGQFLANIGRTFGEKVVKSPAATTLTETLIAGGAGAGGYLIEQEFPDVPGIRLIGEISSGTALSIAPSALLATTKAAGRGTGSLAMLLPAVRTVVTTAKDMVQKHSVTGANQRVVNRLERTGFDKSQVESSLAEPTLPGLTPAQQSASPELLALERSVIESSDELKTQSTRQIDEMNTRIKDSLQELPGAVQAGNQFDVKTQFELLQGHLKDLLNTRINIAAQKSAEALDKIGPNINGEVANRIVRKELDTALVAARAQEDELYKMIPQDARSPTTQTRLKLESIKNETAFAQRKDIPEEAIEAFGEKGLKGVTTVKELLGLRSKLREVARLARADGKNNKARIANEIADTIDSDIARSQAGEEGKLAIDNAVNFSRKVKERFNQGTVGKIMGRTKQGDDAIDPSVTLDLTARGGKQNSGGRLAYDNIVKAFDSPEAPNSESVINAAQDWVKNQFLKTTVENGVVNPRKAATFLRSNSELLERMPETRRLLQDAADTQSAVNVAESQSKRVDFRKSRADIFINKGSDKAFDSITQAKNPAAAVTEINNLMNQAAKDTTGLASQGLKNSFVDWFTTRATSGNYISGRKMLNMMDDPMIGKMITTLFKDNPGALNKLKVIANTAQRMDMARETGKSVEGILGDTPGNVITRILAVSGAATGRAFGRKIGSGGTVQIPGHFSKMFQDFAKKGLDPAKRFITDMMSDEALFKAGLKLKVTPKGEVVGPKESIAKFNTWMAGVLVDLDENNPETREPIDISEAPGAISNEMMQDLLAN